MFFIPMAVLCLFLSTVHGQKIYSRIIDCTSNQNLFRSNPLKTDSRLSQNALALARTAVIDGDLSNYQRQSANLYIDDMDGHFAMTNSILLCQVAIDNWHNQVVDYNSLESEREISGKMRFYQDYTQMVWNKTTHVGCAYAQSIERTVIVCSYSPGGNERGQFKRQVMTNSMQRSLQTCDLKTLCLINDPDNDIMIDKLQSNSEKKAVLYRIQQSRELCNNNHENYRNKNNKNIDYENQNDWRNQDRTSINDNPYQNNWRDEDQYSWRNHNRKSTTQKPYQNNWRDQDENDSRDQDRNNWRNQDKTSPDQKPNQNRQKQNQNFNPDGTPKTKAQKRREWEENRAKNTNKETDSSEEDGIYSGGLLGSDEDSAEQQAIPQNPRNTRSTPNRSNIPRPTSPRPNNGNNNNNNNNGNGSNGSNNANNRNNSDINQRLKNLEDKLEKLLSQQARKRKKPRRLVPLPYL